MLIMYVLSDIGVNPQLSATNDYNDALPTLLTVQSQRGEENTIFIFMRWDNTNTLRELYDLRISLFLNDSDDSAYGPGIFLDACATPITRQPCTEPTTNLPGQWRTVSRIGDFGYHKRFGLFLEDPELIEAGKTYTITWRTSPGVAERDNAQFEFNTSFVGRCWLSGVQWPVTPIPGIVQFDQGAFNDCLTTWVFLPAIQGE